MVSKEAVPLVSPFICLKLIAQELACGRSLGTILGYPGECSLLAQDKCYCCLTKFAVFSVVQDRKNLLKEFTNGKARVLVCTDIASRGIDSTQVRGLPTLTLHCCYQYTLLWRRYTHTHTITHTHTHTQVTHVVLFDFPNTIVDYLHRVGRTGRVGSQAGCKTTAFMTHKRDIRLAWKIKVNILLWKSCDPDNDLVMTAITCSPK